MPSFVIWSLVGIGILGLGFACGAVWWYRVMYRRGEKWIEDKCLNGREWFIVKDLLRTVFTGQVYKVGGMPAPLKYPWKR